MSNSESSAFKPPAANNQSCAPSPDYSLFIHTVEQNIYDPKTLGNLSQLQNEYSCHIHSRADAIKYANKALSITKDPYTVVWSPAEVKAFQQQESGTRTGFGVRMNAVPDPADKSADPKLSKPIFIVDTVPGSPAEKAGIQPGDQITQINGHKIVGEHISDMEKQLAGKAGTKADFTIARGKQTLHKQVARAVIDVPDIYGKDLGNGISYLRINDFVTKEGPQQLLTELEKDSSAKGYIIDLRGNPGGVVDDALVMASMFVDQGNLMSMRERKTSDPKHPQYSQDTFDVSQDQFEMKQGNSVVGSSQRVPDMVGDKPVVVLTDRNTASAAEIFAGALHDTAHDKIIGERTFGKGIGQGIFPLGDADVKVTDLHYNTPSGFWPGDGSSHRIGIQPDIKVSESPGAVYLTAGDTQLQAALKYLRQETTKI